MKILDVIQAESLNMGQDFFVSQGDLKFNVRMYGDSMILTLPTAEAGGFLDDETEVHFWYRSMAPS